MSDLADRSSQSARFDRSRWRLRLTTGRSWMGRLQVEGIPTEVLDQLFFHRAAAPEPSLALGVSLQIASHIHTNPLRR